MLPVHSCGSGALRLSIAALRALSTTQYSTSRIQRSQYMFKQVTDLRFFFLPFQCSARHQDSQGYSRIRRTHTHSTSLLPALTARQPSAFLLLPEVLLKEPLPAFASLLCEEGIADLAVGTFASTWPMLHSTACTALAHALLVTVQAHPHATTARTLDVGKTARGGRLSVSRVESEGAAAALVEAVLRRSAAASGARGGARLTARRKLLAVGDAPSLVARPRLRGRATQRAAAGRCA